MNKKDCWNLFLNLGTVDSYLVYRMFENRSMEEGNGGTENAGLDSERCKYE